MTYHLNQWQIIKVTNGLKSYKTNSIKNLDLNQVKKLEKPTMTNGAAHVIL